MGGFHVLHDVLEGLALGNIEAVACLLMRIPVIHHGLGDTALASLRLWSLREAVELRCWSVSVPRVLHREISHTVCCICTV